MWIEVAGVWCRSAEGGGLYSGKLRPQGQGVVLSCGCVGGRARKGKERGGKGKRRGREGKERGRGEEEERRGGRLGLRRGKE